MIFWLFEKEPGQQLSRLLNYNCQIPTSLLPVVGGEDGEVAQINHATSGKPQSPKFKAKILKSIRSILPSRFKSEAAWNSGMQAGPESGALP